MDGWVGAGVVIQGVVHNVLPRASAPLLWEYALASAQGELPLFHSCC